MKINKIIDMLCRHEINKEQAVDLIEEIVETLKSKKAVKFFVEQVAFSSENNDAILNLRAPYSYYKIEGKVEIGDSIDVIILP